VGLVAAYALLGPGAALSASPPPRPLSSAPSEYVEVVPTGGGGSSGGSRTQEPAPADGSASATSNPSSTLGAVSDAIGEDTRRLTVLGATMLVVTLWLAGVTIRRREAASRRAHEPKGW
jgi:hypothetical protein